MRLVALALPLLSVCMCSTSLAQTVSTDCRETVLTRKPGWALSGGFTQDGSQLLVVDSLKSTILRYSSSGDSLGLLREPVQSVIRDQLPVTGKTRGEGFILEVTDGLMLMDKDLRPQKTQRIQTRVGAGADSWSITGLWEWEPVGDTDIVAFADIGHGPNPYLPQNAESAFVRFSLQDPAHFQILERAAVGEVPNKAYFRSTYSYITSLGDVAYYLSMNNGLELFKQERGKREENISKRLPPGLASPRLKEWLYARDFTKMMGDIEKEAIPVGLFGWEKSLYLLYRTPEGEGTRWTLYSIDPAGKVATHATDLPIRANHVTVIPGPKNWAFLEKGPVLGLGAQDISRLLLIPSDLIQRAPSLAGRPLCGN